MFYMKNDDMDELFRKAAENYEVDTSKASGWDAVNKVLRNADGLNMEKTGKGKRKYRFFFWWFLLLPALLLGYYSWKKTGSTYKEDITAKTTSGKTTKDVYEGSSASKSFENTIAGKSSAEPEKSTLNASPGNNNAIIEKDAGDNSLSEKNVISGEKNTIQNNPVPNFIEDKENRQGHSLSNNAVLNNRKKIAKNNQRNLIVVDNENNTSDRLIAQPLKNNKDNIRNKHTNNTGISKPDGYAGKTITGSFQYVFTDHDGKALPVISFEKNIPGMVMRNESLSVAHIDSSLKSNNNKVDRKDHYLYVAAVIAPDLSSVKFQRIAGTGSSVGLLLGYRINKHWHIETGALWEKKIYCTEGKYFDKSKLSPYLRDVEIMNADGNCYMITIPLNVRYNISAGEKNNWFVSTGMSSYLMNKEYYDFTYRHPGGQPMRKGYDYKTAEKNWMTVINLNLGYERTFLKTFNFRIEPYFRLPVSGVGTGNLSLSSGGVYIGIGKKF